LAPFVVTTMASGNTDTKAWAVYANATYQLTDRLSAGVGVRYSYEEKERESVDSMLRVPGSTINTYDGDWNAWTPKVSVDYRLTEQALIYASVGKGFQS